MKLVILGTCVSKKNSRQLFNKGGRLVNIPSKSYKAWEEDALWQLKSAEPVKAYPVALTVIFYAKDHRNRDLDNMLSSVMDCLQRARILEDDGCKYVPEIDVRYAGVDETPRVEVMIDYLPEE